MLQFTYIINADRCAAAVSPPKSDYTSGNGLTSVSNCCADATENKCL